jgi:hypothetical protein
MKRIIIFLTMIILIVFADNKINAKTNVDIGGGVYFYSSLAPYGNWIEINGGITVWRPARVDREWQPYTDGYWIWTNDGWFWKSYEPYGYITYHYGRWYYDDYYGWIWVPDNQWAPAWVEWRYDDDYIGWAPLPPYAGFSASFGINFTMNFFTPYNRWHFVRYRYFCDPYSYRYYVPSREVYRFYDRTRYRTNYGYSDGRVINRGVDIDFVRKRSGQNIRERMIERVNDPGQLRNGSGRNSDRVRSYFVERDKLNRENFDGRNIQRSDRRSSLDISKIGIDERNSGERNRGAGSESIIINRQRDINRRSMDNGNVSPNQRERGVVRERNTNPNLNRERSFQRNSNDNPNLNRERTFQRNSNDNPNLNRERTFQRNSNDNPNLNRERTFQRNRSDNPVLRQERKFQKNEIRRESRQIERSKGNRQNERSRDVNKDRGRKGR